MKIILKKSIYWIAFALLTVLTFFEALVAFCLFIDQNVLSAVLIIEVFVCYIFPLRAIDEPNNPDCPLEQSIKQASIAPMPTITKVMLTIHVVVSSIASVYLHCMYMA